MKTNSLFDRLIRNLIPSPPRKIDKEQDEISCNSLTSQDLKNMLKECEKNEQKKQKIECDGPQENYGASELEKKSLSKNDFQMEKSELENSFISNFSYNKEDPKFSTYNSPHLDIKYRQHYFICSPHHSIANQNETDQTDNSIPSEIQQLLASDSVQKSQNLAPQLEVFYQLEEQEQLALNLHLEKPNNKKHHKKPISNNLIQAMEIVPEAPESDQQNELQYLNGYKIFEDQNRIADDSHAHSAAGVELKSINSNKDNNSYFKQLSRKQDQIMSESQSSIERVQALINHSDHVFSQYVNAANPAKQQINMELESESFFEYEKQDRANIDDFLDQKPFQKFNIQMPPNKSADFNLQKEKQKFCEANNFMPFKNNIPKNKFALEEFDQTADISQVPQQDNTRELSEIQSFEFNGFTTGKGNKIPIDQKKLEFAEKLFDEHLDSSKTDKNLISQVSQDDNRLDLSENKPIQFNGFTNGKGNLIPINQKNLEQAEKLFDEHLDSSQNDLNITKEEENAENNIFRGFQNGKGKKLDINESGLKKASMLFLDQTEDSLPQNPQISNRDDCDDRNPSKIDNKQEDFGFIGFKTGVGHQIKFDEKNIKNAQILLGEEDSQHEQEPLFQIKNKVAINNDEISQKGSLNNKIASVDAKLIPKKHGIVFEFDDDSDGQDNDKNSGQNDLSLQPQQQFMGFKKGNGKQIDFTDENMKKAEKLFEFQEAEKPQKTQTEEFGFGGFMKGNGSKINLTSANIQKAKQLFGDDDFEETDNNFKGIEKKEESKGQLEPQQEQMGFKTAGGQKLEFDQNQKQSIMSKFEFSPQIESQKEPIEFNGNDKKEIQKKFDLDDDNGDDDQYNEIIQQLKKKQQEMIKKNQPEPEPVKNPRKFKVPVKNSSNSNQTSNTINFSTPSYNNFSESQTKTHSHIGSNNNNGFQNTEFTSGFTGFSKARLSQIDEQEESESANKMNQLEKFMNKFSQMDQDEDDIEFEQILKANKLQLQAENKQKETKNPLSLLKVEMPTLSNNSNGFKKANAFSAVEFQISRKNHNTQIIEYDDEPSQSTKQSRFSQDEGDNEDEYQIQRGYQKRIKLDLNESLNKIDEEIPNVDNQISVTQASLNQNGFQNSAKSSLSRKFSVPKVQGNETPTKLGENSALKQRVPTASSFWGDSINSNQQFTSFEPLQFDQSAHQNDNLLVNNLDNTSNSVYTIEKRSFEQLIGVGDQANKGQQNLQKPNIMKKSEFLQEEQRDNAFQKDKKGETSRIGGHFQNRLVEFEDNFLIQLQFNQNFINEINEDSQNKQEMQIKQMNFRTLCLKSDRLQKLVAKKGSSQNKPVGPSIESQNSAKDNSINEILNRDFMCSCALKNFSQSQQSIENQPHIENKQMAQYFSPIGCMCEGTLQITFDIIYEHLCQRFKETLDKSWVRHQYRYVFWKISSYEKLQNRLQRDCSASNIHPSQKSLLISNIKDGKFFPLNKELTLRNIINQLEYRLYAEKFESFRSPLKQIFEQDMVLSQHMVLLVGSIRYDSVLRMFIIELTDGWYSIHTMFSNIFQDYRNEYYAPNNQLLSDLLESGRLNTGQKIHVTGLRQTPFSNSASQFSVESGYQKDKIVVQFYYNSMSRAKNTSPLGVIPGQPNFLKCLKSIRQRGGLISMVDVFIIKKYGLLESHSQFVSKGRKIFIEDKEEEQERERVPQEEQTKQQTSNSNFMQSSKLQQKQQNSKQIQRKFLSCRLKVVDALQFYEGGETIDDQQENFDQVPITEIDLYNLTCETYDELREGMRVRISNLKTSFISIEPQPRFSIISMKYQKRVLNLETSQASNISRCEDFVTGSDEIKKIREYGEGRARDEKNSLQDFEDMLNEDQKNQLMANDRINCEIDVIMYIVSSTENRYLGVTARNRAVCIESHDKAFFGLKTTSSGSQVFFEDKSKKIAIFYNVNLTSFRLDHCTDTFFYSLQTTQNTTLSFNFNQIIPKYQEHYNDVQYLVSNNCDKFTELVSSLSDKGTTAQEYNQPE